MAFFFFLSRRWKRSIRPFAIWWYVVVRSCMSCFQSSDSNRCPQSVVAADGTPNLEIQLLKKT